MVGRRVAAVGLLVLANAAAQSPTPAPMDACKITIQHEGTKYTDSEALDHITEVLETISEMQDDYGNRKGNVGGNSVNMTKLYQDKAYENIEKYHDIMRAINITRSDVEQVLKIVDEYELQVNTICVICGAMFIVFGRFGFMARHLGMVTSKSIKCTVVQEMLAISVGTLGWWATGYGVAFGDDNYAETEKNGLVGWDGYFGDHGHSDTVGKGFRMAFFVLQMAYCLLAVGIPVGSITERSTVTFVVFMSLAVSMVIYPVCVHVFWDKGGMFSAYRESGNLLFDCGTIDFAGSGVLHLCGGTVALVASLIVGPRKDRWVTPPNLVKPVIQSKPQSSPAFETFGGLLLFTCSIANTGFATREFVEDSVVAGKAMSNTLIAAGVASFVSVMIGHFYTGVVSPQLACGGLVAGAAAISAGCASMDMEGAVLTGFCGAWAYYVGGCLMLKLHIDDVSHAISIHGFAGGFGLIAAGLFTQKEAYQAAYYDNRVDACYGTFYNGGIAQLASQAMACAFVVAWTVLSASVILGTVHVMFGSRYPLQWEKNGLDYHKFGGESQFSHVAVNHDKNRWAHGILTDTQHGVTDADEDGGEES